MDLIQAYYQSNSESEIDPPPPVAADEPAEIGQPEPGHEPPEAVEVEEVEERLENKKNFKKSIVDYPTRPTDIWECNHCKIQIASFVNVI